MTKISEISNNFIDSILPPYGTPKTVRTPIWNESQHMFITEQYTSDAGNTYYLGVRFSDRFITILHIGLYHSWTYINDVEIYSFDGKERCLVGKTKLDQFYSEELIRSTTENLLESYIEGQLKLNNAPVDRKQLNNHVRELVDKSYCSLLNDSNTVKRLEAVKPLLLPNN